MKVLSEKNVFVNSEINVIGNGERWQIRFPQSEFSTIYPRKMKFILTQFVMKRNMFPINPTNNLFFIQLTDGTSVRAYPVEIAPGNYDTYAGMVVALKNALDFTSLTYSTAQPNYLLNSNFTSGGNPIKWLVSYDATSRGYSFQAQDNGGANITISADVDFFSCQTRDASKLSTSIPNSTAQMVADVNRAFGGYVDTHEIVGGKVSRANSPQSLFNVTTANSLWTSPYVANLSSLECIYLRTSVNSNNFASTGFDVDNCPTFNTYANKHIRKNTFNRKLLQQ